MSLIWKPDWPVAQANLTRWWRGDGLALAVKAPRERPWLPLAPITPPDDVRRRWTDPRWRLQDAERSMAATWYGGEAFPYFDTQIGPGSLGTMLGAAPHFAPTTVWYDPVIATPDAHPPLVFRAAGNAWYDTHLALVEAGLAAARGRYLVGIPDLIENLDTLAALRDNRALLLDLVERPAWVRRCLHEITVAYRDVFDRFYARVAGPEGGNAFSAFDLWGPGRTAKVQCDFACMISPAMFNIFVAPELTDQCAQLEYTLFHLDGTQAVKHLEALLAIAPLRAIQWTPQAGLPSGGAPDWYALYRRIKAAGKGVQVCNVKPAEVLPLLDAVGPEKVFVRVTAGSEAEGRDVLAAVQARYPGRRDAA